MASKSAAPDNAAYEQLAERHGATLERAIEAVATRESWSPFSDSPSSKIHGAEKPAAGRAAFERLLGTRYEIDQPGIAEWIGNEVSPYTREALGITYPRSEPAALIAAGSAALRSWRKVDFETRAMVCLEIAQRLYDRNFEMAHGIMHVAGQSYVQAFAGSGPNALDRGIEALAYAVKAMRDVTPKAVWRRKFGPDDVALDKRYTIMPRGLALVICCASFPTWNAHPALFANLATGNPAIMKPHPIAILPVAMTVAVAREVLEDFGFDPNVVTLATDTVEEPVAEQFIADPAVQIIDFTGSARYGSHLESTITRKALFTETSGVNSVVMHSVADLSQSARAIARSTALFSAQMCTSPQTVFVPRDGIAAGTSQASPRDVAEALASEIDALVGNPAAAASVMGAVQAELSMDVVARVREELAGRDDVEIVREASPYAHPDYPDARTLSPLVAIIPKEAEALYADEQFGPVLFVVPTDDGDDAVAQATRLAKENGTIATYLYSTDEDFIARSTDAYEEAGANLSINLHGTMWINFAAAYSDYHVTGLNPAGNACLADLAFAASRFRIVQRRRPE
ncbi:phenylacetic acid degradation protein PaaN [Pelagerythrobacter marinus]|uniref:phenylacetic acid degradation protein PaaN n=1 Tax=Pelagerythrobacter marinus TaxID=538382 RepID=UPI0020374623|nr:phenylacetic acid degradation protein PaaN [Pelagerythrobacter marinus]USA39443.1 phenylacetic acid degradation protein PaaN [Pelagerythrobacter marinus]WPZ06417.1 phenylacetic acid degradation protein PaaN [Pelagerythrobacter marinus]